MILIPSNVTPKKWDSIDRSRLEEFLATDTGSLLLHWLQYLAPDLLDGDDVNKTLVMNGRVKGYQEVLERIITLTVEQPEEVKGTENYPSLDDDSKWNDREKSPTE